jgi:transposase
MAGRVPDALCDEIDAQLGWIQPRVNGGDKKALNVSLLVGRTEADPRSTIRFFRTHVGSVGNLLTKILESRSPKAGPLIFQGDLSTSNLPNEDIRADLIFMIAGCAAHARRPFWRSRQDDEQFCYFMLRCFLFLSKLETLIDERGRTRENVLRIRGRYGRMMWIAMRNRCIAATTSTIPGPATWPPGTELNKAANYVINHFKELTLYLDHPELAFTNNAQERALRIEKCMLSSSKFRKTKRGRIVLDILRTINATCTAANVDFTDYLRFFFKHLKEFHDQPEKLTPFAFAKSLQKVPPAITVPLA